MGRGGVYRSSGKHRKTGTFRAMKNDSVARGEYARGGCIRQLVLELGKNKTRYLKGQEGLKDFGKKCGSYSKFDGR